MATLADFAGIAHATADGVPDLMYIVQNYDTRGARVVVRFVRTASPFNAGEKAGFSSAAASMLVDAGYAVVVP